MRLLTNFIYIFSIVAFFPVEAANMQSINGAEKGANAFVQSTHDDVQTVTKRLNSLESCQKKFGFWDGEACLPPEVVIDNTPAYGNALMGCTYDKDCVAGIMYCKHYITGRYQCGKSSSVVDVKNGNTFYVKACDPQYVKVRLGSYDRNGSDHYDVSMCETGKIRRKFSGGQWTLIDSPLPSVVSMNERYNPDEDDTAKTVRDFKIADKNNDDRLSRTEFMAHMEDVGMANSAKNKLFNNTDRNDNDFITVSEYLSVF